MPHSTASATASIASIARLGALAALAACAAGYRAAPADEPSSAEEVVFEEKFSGKLSGGWTWVREDRAAWRLAKAGLEAGLEVRIQPGNMWGRVPAKWSKSLSLAGRREFSGVAGASAASLRHGAYPQGG